MEIWHWTFVAGVGCWAVIFLAEGLYAWTGWDIFTDLCSGGLCFMLLNLTGLTLMFFGFILSVCAFIFGGNRVLVFLSYFVIFFAISWPIRSEWPSIKRNFSI